MRAPQRCTATRTPSLRMPMPRSGCVDAGQALVDGLAARRAAANSTATRDLSWPRRQADAVASTPCPMPPAKSRRLKAGGRGFDPGRHTAAQPRPGRTHAAGPCTSRTGRPSRTATARPARWPSATTSDGRASRCRSLVSVPACGTWSDANCSSRRRAGAAHRGLPRSFTNSAVLRAGQLGRSQPESRGTRILERCRRSQVAGTAFRTLVPSSRRVVRNEPLLLE